MNNYSVAHKLASKILGDKLPFYYIFPAFFLTELERTDTVIYGDFLSGEIMNKLLDGWYAEKVDDLIKSHYDRLCAIQDKTDVIAVIINEENPLEFFQKTISSNYLSKVESFSLEELLALKERVKKGEISFLEGKKLLNF